MPWRAPGHFCVIAAAFWTSAAAWQVRADGRRAGSKPGDIDGDGQADRADVCPLEAEDRDGFQDEDGCPDLDDDRDGVFDTRDECPGEREVLNGLEDDDGCPDPPARRGPVAPAMPPVAPDGMHFEDDRVILEERVLFNPNRARVRTAARVALGSLIRMWQPDWSGLVIEGHADSRGSKKFNQWLSEERATRVRKALVELGLSPAILQTRGYGSTRPRATGSDDATHQRNRRIELVVLRNPAAIGNTSTALAPAGLGPR